MRGLQDALVRTSNSVLIRLNEGKDGSLKVTISYLAF